MFDGLKDLNERLNRDVLRVERPHHVIFFCGGETPEASEQRTCPSLRDYLYRARRIQRLLEGQIVLAETAQQLYRDTTYPDLISFEEDIARIASIVLVITESAGSLAELGSFSSEPIIRDALRIIISENHFDQNSFVRWGPVKRVADIDRSRVGTFPWRLHRNSGNLVKSSASPHFREIADFINEKTGEIELSHAYRLIADKAIFFDIMWILSLLEAVPPEPLYEAVRIVHPEASDDFIRNKLFALKICRWIDSFSYSGRDFYYLPNNVDPYDYAFLEGRRVRDVAATKLAISNEYRGDVHLTRNILQRLADKRAGRL